MNPPAPTFAGVKNVVLINMIMVPVNQEDYSVQSYIVAVYLQNNGIKEH